MDRAIQELGADEHRRDQLLDARIETTLTDLVKEWHQAIDVLLGDWTAERAAGEVGGDAPRTCALWRPAVGATDEDLPAAWRIRHPRRVERAVHLDAAHQTRLAIPAAELVARQKADELVGLNACALDERDRNIVETRLHLYR